MNEPSMNQYAPPLAAVADVNVGEGVGELKLFSSQGRIGRLRYLAYGTGASLVYQALVGVSAASGSAAFTGVLVLAAFAVFLWFTVITGIKRCHDINISGWWALTMIIPVIALIWLFVPGSQGANRFGPPPPPNTLGVKLLGYILPAIFFIGILAAIALPAYKDYTVRARAAQSQSQAQPR